MKQFIIPFIAYIVISPLANFLFDNIYFSYFLKILVTGIFIFIYRKHYKIKLKYDTLTILTGIAMFLLWIGLEGKYPMISEKEFAAANALVILFKIAGSIIVAPLIEEFFVRSFLIRFIINQKWENVPIGKYTFSSFILTALFFGFSHNRWLPGLIAGILLNLLLYKKKDISNCVVAHALANLLVAIYVITTQNWVW